MAIIALGLCSVSPGPDLDADLGGDVQASNINHLHRMPARAGTVADARPPPRAEPGAHPVGALAGQGGVACAPAVAASRFPARLIFIKGAPANRSNVLSEKPAV
jgi:hypothetical protein